MPHSLLTTDSAPFKLILHKTLFGLPPMDLTLQSCIQEMIGAAVGRNEGGNSILEELQNNYVGGGTCSHYVRTFV